MHPSFWKIEEQDCDKIHTWITNNKVFTTTRNSAICQGFKTGACTPGKKTWGTAREKAPRKLQDLLQIVKRENQISNRGQGAAGLWGISARNQMRRLISAIKLKSCCPKGLPLANCSKALGYFLQKEPFYSYSAGYLLLAVLTGYARGIPLVFSLACFPYIFKRRSLFSLRHFEFFFHFISTIIFLSLLQQH